MKPGEFYDRAATLAREGVPFVIATITQTAGSSPRKIGAKMLVTCDGETVETIGGGVLERQVVADALEALRAGVSCERRYVLRREDERALDALCGGEATMFLDVHTSQRTLLIAGAGHVGVALAVLGTLLDFRVVVVDPREEMLARERLPGVDELVCGDLGRLAELVTVTEHAHVVIVTHDHQHDGDALRAALATPAAYIGMMGSANKIKTIFGRLRDEGVEPAALERVRAPIGLDIGAQTPAELALCIMAEIVAETYGKAPGAAPAVAPAAGVPDQAVEEAAGGGR